MNALFFLGLLSFYSVVNFLRRSTFLVSFLADLPKSAAAAPNSSEESRLITPAKQSVLSEIHVLVAEDSEDNQFLIQHMLTKLGATVDVANNGLEAFRMGLHGNYDIVLMDIQMPEMDGYEATRSLREAGFRKPIIALTAHAMAEERARSKAAGCNGHLTKPLNLTELTDTIKNYVLLQKEKRL